MPPDFLSKLRRIKKVSEQQAAASAEAQREAEQSRAEIRGKYYELREKLVVSVDQSFDDFCREFDGFSKQASYVGEDYCLSVSYDELVMASGRDVNMERLLSQFTVRIKGLGDSAFFVVSAKTLLRNKECGQRTWDEKILEAQVEPILAFAQNEVLRFAKAYASRETISQGA